MKKKIKITKTQLDELIDGGYNIIGKDTNSIGIQHIRSNTPKHGVSTTDDYVKSSQNYSTHDYYGRNMSESFEYEIRDGKMYDKDGNLIVDIAELSFNDTTKSIIVQAADEFISELQSEEIDIKKAAILYIIKNVLGDEQ